MFAADLLREIAVPCEISFIKVASYSGTQSTNHVKELIGLNSELRGRTVIILEDIVDSGVTIKEISNTLNNKGAKEIKVATALMKPDAYKGEQVIDYFGIKI